MRKPQVIVLGSMFFILIYFVFFYQSWTANAGQPTTASQKTFRNETIAVSAWYAIGNNAKRSEVQYHFYLYNFRRFQTPTLMFTNEPDFFKAYPEFENLIVVDDTTENMRKRTGYSVEQWRKQHDLDSENFRHTLELYYIWIGRVFLLVEAMKRFPEAEWFFWVDSGGARNENRWSIPRYIQPEGLPDDKLIMFTPRFREEFPCFGEGTKIPSTLTPEQDHLIREDCIQGGSYGGSRTSVQLFIKDFSDTLSYFFKNDLFAGKDQCVFNYMYVKDPDKYAVFGARDQFEGDRWFWFFHFLQWHSHPVSNAYSHLQRPTSISSEKTSKRRSMFPFRHIWKHRFAISIFFNVFCLIYIVHEWWRGKDRRATYGVKPNILEVESFLK